MDSYKRARTAPHPNRPKWVPDGCYSEDDIGAGICLLGFCGGIAAFFLAGLTWAGVCAVTPLHWYTPTRIFVMVGGVAAWWAFLVTYFLILPLKVWRYREFPTEAQADAARHFAKCTPAKRAVLSTAWAALAASDKDDYRTAKHVYWSTNEAYDTHERTLRELVPNPHLEDALRELTLLRAQTDSLKEQLPKSAPEPHDKWSYVHDFERWDRRP